jgi:hypothetical protein
VPDLVGLILRAPDLTGIEVLAGAAGLAGVGVFSVVGVLGAGCSGAAGAARPAEAGSGIVRISGTAGPFPLLSIPALLLLAPASSVVPAVPAPLVGAPESGHLVGLLCPYRHQKLKVPVEPPSPCGRRWQSCLAPAEDRPSPGRWFYRAQAKMPAPGRPCDLQKVCRGWQWPPAFQ